MIQSGTISIPCQQKGKCLTVFFLVGTVGPAMLRLKACRALDLVSLHCTLETKNGA